MSTKKSSRALFIAAMLASSVAMAAAPSSEFSASGIIDSSSGSGYKTSSTVISGSYGHYFSPKLVGRVSLVTAGTESTSSGTTTTTTFQVLGVGAKYYLGEAAKSAWVPYVFGDVNSVSVKGGGVTITGNGFDAGGGVSNFLSETVSLDIDGRLYTNNLSGGGTTVTTNGTLLLVGFTSRF